MPGSVDLRKLESDGQTLEQIFSKVRAGSAEAGAAVDTLIKKTQDLLNLNSEQVDAFADYLNSLDDISKSWDKINIFAENSLKFSKEYLFNLDNIRGMFDEILSESSSIRSRTAEQLRNVRTLRDLSGEIQRSLKNQDSLEEKSIKSLSKRVNKTVELYEWNVKKAAGLSGDVDLSNPSLEVQSKIVAARAREEEKIAVLRRRMSFATSREKSDLQAMIQYHSVLLEKLDLENLKRAESVKTSQEEISNISKQVRARTAGADFLSQLLNKVGLSGLTGRYEKSVQDQVKAQVERESAQKDFNDVRADRFGRLEEKAEQVRLAESRARRAREVERDLRGQVSGSVFQEQKQLAATGRRSNGQFASRDEILDAQWAVYELEQKLRKAVEERGRAEEGINLARRSERIAIEDQNTAELEAHSRLKAALEAEQKTHANTFTILTGISKQNIASAAAAGKSKVLASGFASKFPGLAGIAGKLGAVAGGLGSIFGALAKSLVGATGPLGVAVALLLKVWDTFKAVNVDAAELKRRVGSWEIGTAAFNSRLATSVDWLKTATELADFTGLNSVTLFDNKQIAAAAEFKNLTGASADMANNLLVRSKLVGQSVDEYRESLTKGANVGNAINRSTINLREVQNGVLKASDATALSYGNNAEALGRAVVAAKNLGMELTGIEKISDNLLNFESSIANEMEAQLLTGMQLNLSKAREFALENNLEGVAREVRNQGISAVKFANMNRIQREGIAKALGMSADELARSLTLQELQNGASKQALADAMHMTTEQIEAMAVQDRWRIATQKLAQAFTPILEVLIDILDPIAKIFSWVSGIVGAISNAVGLVLRLFGLADRFPKVFGFSEKFDAGRWGGVGSQRSSGSGFAASGEGSPKAFSAGIGSTVTASLLLGATFPKVAAAGSKMFTALLSGIGKTARGFVGLGKTVTHLPAAMRLARVRAGAAVRGGFGGAAATAAGTAGKVAGSAGSVAKAAGRAGVRGLPVIGKAIGGFLSAIGVKGMAIALGIGLALRLAAPAIEAFGKAIKGTLEGVGALVESAAKGLSTIVETVKGMTLADIGKLALMGPAIGMFGMSLLAGTTGFALFALTGLPVLAILSKIGPGLDTTATSIKNLSVSIRDLGTSLNSLSTGKLLALGLVGKKISSTSGRVAAAQGQTLRSREVSIEEQKSEKTDLSALESKLDTMIGLLREGQTVEFSLSRFNEAQGKYVTALG